MRIPKKVRDWLRSDKVRQGAKAILKGRGGGEEPSPPQKRKPIYGYMIHQQDEEFVQWVDRVLPEPVNRAGVSLDGKAGKWPNMLRRDASSIFDLDTSRFEASLKYAEDRGHKTKWHQGIGYKPKWVPSKGYNLASVVDRVRDNLKFLEIILQRFGDRIDLIDLVNEPIDTQARGFRFADGVDPITVAEIEGYFRHAADFAPNASLGINEYGCEHPGAKHTLLVNLAKELLDRGAPLARIGLQGHLKSWDAPSYQEWCDAIGAFTELGLKVDITENDCQIYQESDSRPAADEVWYQFHAIAEMVDAATDMEVEHLITWGLRCDKWWGYEKWSIPEGSDLPLPFTELGLPRNYWSLISQGVEA